MENLSLDEILAANTYPGRGIIVGQSLDGSKAVIAYFIMGRSENSRNRVFRENSRGGITTVPFNETKVTDPGLIMYNPVLTVNNYQIITNGDQTDTLYTAMLTGKSYVKALMGRTYEPDDPIFTPRISAILKPDGSYMMSLLKSDAYSEACMRYFYEYEGTPGYGHYIHTYDHCDGDLPKPFAGEPKQVSIKDMNLDEWTNLIWQSLNNENKVALFTRYIDLETHTCQSKIINKNEQLLEHPDMEVLVVGSGGREHALIKKILESPSVSKVACCPGNGGIAYDADCYPVSATDITGVVNLARKLSSDYVVVSPSEPLAAGMVDALNAAGFKTFGPLSKAAELEGSRAFAKEFMKKYNIPTARYEVFSSPGEAIKYIRQNNTFPIVIKPAGLTRGGVTVAKDFYTANKAVYDIMQSKAYGAAGSSIVIEEFLTGTELSVCAFTDGKTILPMVASAAYKGALDNDEGEITCGMGAVSPSPYYTPQVEQECMNKIFVPTMKALNKEGRTFKGCLQFDLILTKDGIKVIDYNCTFGASEAQVVLPRLKTDIMKIFEAVGNGTLGDLKIKWSDRAAACVVLASGGYPGRYEKGFEITGLKNGQIDNATVYHAGTALRGGRIVTDGGIVLGVTASGNTADEAVEKCYTSADNITFRKKQFRTDIGNNVTEIKK